MRLGLEPEMEATTSYVSHVRTLAKSMDNATLQSALEFHRMYVLVLKMEMEARRQSSERVVPASRRFSPPPHSAEAS